MQKVAVVILNWNGEKFLKKFLPRVVSNTITPNVDVIVADNGSTDESVLYIESNHPNVKVIRLDKNYGFASGYNLALKQVEAEYYVLLNSDVDVPQGWLNPLIQFMDKNPLTAACMPKILDYNNPSHFEYAGAAGGFIDYLGYPFCRGRILSHIEEDNGQYNEPLEVFWASGACLFFRSKAYWEANGLDDDFFAHMEEIDLCWRLINMGYSNYCIPDSKVYHVGGGTLPNNNPRKLYYNYRNSLFMLYKNLPKSKLFTTIFSRLILDGLSAIVYLLSGKFSFFKAVFLAHCNYWKNIGILRKKRKILNLNRVNNSSKILHKSVLSNFFLLKRKTFNSYPSLYSKL
ncbi:MAG: glycosyltransferase family 2 protein [Bacteroidales bacterium]|nr:glycosyltransferase family 2 protein [Bacteroidales bacterium]